MLSIYEQYKHIFQNSRKFGKTTDDMKQHFLERTNYHISLVQKYLDKIIALNDSRLDNKILEQEKIHDQSKFKEPEYSPYLHINWKYYLKDQGKEYNPPDEIKNQMHAASFHHIVSNKHHPDYWDKNITPDNLNSEDRDKPAKIVDSTRMPPTYVASMIADWLAMSEEKKTDPYEWAQKNINKRWKFTDEQVKLIYDLLNRIWKNN